ncbi:MAG: arginine decarboxylase [Flavobacteriales bacterium]|nr:arginine decarboxylase [Flavobacteriales bacterium]MBV6484656.1 Biosynthetic arginine decarboxylase [Flavobacteriales bacterium]MBX2959573.1 arginine decarboxylase [Flavobacteriales bacterium]HRN41398.1 arginine decarboxylase [Vicingus sp.]HRP59829.1 arginine decarboxylase [Vicingus sp.]
MKNKYQDLIEQTFFFPQDGYEVIENELYFHKIPLMDIIKQYGTPLKLTYLPKISEQINKAKTMFKVAMAKVDYEGNYTYCYCTKSSHFSFILEEVLKSDAHIETSSAYDIEILKQLFEEKKLSKSNYIISNGFKREPYLEGITDLMKSGFNIVPVLDNKGELDYYIKNIKNTREINIGIRIASEEEPSFQFYTSRLGIRHKDIKDFYKTKIKPNKNIKLKMLHFFINTGIRDTTYYWSELLKALGVYCDLKTICPELEGLNIGGGLPFKNSLGFEFQYEYIIEEVVAQIKDYCNSKGVKEPNIFTEFGSFTVAESGVNIYSIIDVKEQNDTEMWYMIDNSFITTLPDAWAINQRYILLAINHWNKEFQRANLGGMTCDSLDYYNSEAHISQIFLPKVDNSNEEPLYIAFFNTGAYQESLSGYGGIKHCLIPSPKHVVVDRDEEGEYTTKLFSKEQSAKSMLKILGY